MLSGAVAVSTCVVEYCASSSGVVIEYRTRNREVAGSTHTRSALQATLSKLLNYCVLRLTQPPTLSGTENELRLRGEGLVWLIGAMVCLLAAPWDRPIVC